MAGNVLNKGAGDGEQPLSLDTIMGEVNKSLDAKLSAKLDDFSKVKLGEAIKAQTTPLTDQLTTMNEALAKLVAGNVSKETDGTNKQQIPPEVNVELKSLKEKLAKQENQIGTLTTAKEEAEKKAEQTDRHSAIRGVLTGMKFVNERAGETAFSIVEPHVRRVDDNTLVAGINGDNFPVENFIKDYLSKDHAYLFQTTGMSGSGASGGQSPGIRMGARADIGMIKPGMKPDERAAIVQSIAAALQTQPE